MIETVVCPGQPERTGLIYRIADELREKWVAAPSLLVCTARMSEATRIREIDPYGLAADAYYDDDTDAIAYRSLPPVDRLLVRYGDATFTVDDLIPDGEYALCCEEPA